MARKEMKETPKRLFVQYLTRLHEIPVKTNRSV